MTGQRSGYSIFMIFTRQPTRFICTLQLPLLTLTLMYAVHPSPGGLHITIHSTVYSLMPEV